jgi:hypothetical protein
MSSGSSSDHSSSAYSRYQFTRPNFQGEKDGGSSSDSSSSAAACSPPPAERVPQGPAPSGLVQKVQVLESQLGLLLGAGGDDDSKWKLRTVALVKANRRLQVGGYISMTECVFNNCLKVSLRSLENRLKMVESFQKPSTGPPRSLDLPPTEVRQNVLTDCHNLFSDL